MLDRDSSNEAFDPPENMFVEAGNSFFIKRITLENKRL